MKQVRWSWKNKMSPGSHMITRILAISLMLSGCASTPQHLTEENQNEIKNIAVISLVPERVNFDKIGIVSFADEYTEFDMGRKLTNSILSVTQERIIKSHPDWIVKSAEYDRTAALAKSISLNGFRSDRVKESFADLASKNKLDAIFVVRADADEENHLRGGLNVLLLNNHFDSTQRLAIRANLKVAIINNKGELIAAGEVPAKLDSFKALDPEAYGLKDKMKDNRRPEVLDKLGAEVIVEATRKINLCFDSLGFVDKSGPEAQHINVVPIPGVLIESTEKSPVQAAPTTSSQTVPTTSSFDQCFSRCRQYTDRTKEQCFDACNK
jgi:hypothetical protein